MTVPVDVEPALVQILRANAALTALLGVTDAQPSIFPQSLPPGAILPAVLYQQIVLPPGAQGMGSDSGLQWPTFSFTVMASSAAADGYKTVKTVLRALRQALERVRGTYTVAEGTVTIQDILHLGGRDMQWPNLLSRGYVLDLQVVHL